MKVAASVVASRRDRLAESVTAEGFVPLAVLCRKLGISMATARRDLAHLQAKGRISRIRGGALPCDREDRVATGPGGRFRGLPVRSTSGAAAAMFESPAALALKESICEIGRRAWRRGLVDGTSGHFSARLGEFFLCTPAGVSRGSMRPEMICMVDAAGDQVASHAHWKRSPEMLVDLALYRAAPSAAAVAHAHPPHATAFAVSGHEPPRGLLPEFELFAGPLARADYRMPGSEALARLVGELGRDHSSILLQNHGVICRGTDIEDAYLRLEMIETYCHTISVAARLSGHPTALPAEDMMSIEVWRHSSGISGERRHGAGTSRR